MQSVCATAISHGSREDKMIVQWDKDKRIMLHTESWNGVKITFYIHQFNSAAGECLEEYFISIPNLSKRYIFIYSFVFCFSHMDYAEKAKSVMLKKNGYRRYNWKRFVQSICRVYNHGRRVHFFFS